MAASIAIPAALRAFTDGKREISITGSTVGEALSALCIEYPEIKRHLYEDDGNLRGFVNIFVGEDNIKVTGGLITALQDGSRVSIVPAIAGGCKKC